MELMRTLVVVTVVLNVCFGELRILKAGEEPSLLGDEHEIADKKRMGRSQGNYGDLIYRYRENGDTLILREVVVLPDITSEERDIEWYASTPARRISSVRVLNFGQERAEAYRIDVRGGDAQAIIRVPSLYDPRLLIEVYGV